MGVPMIYLYCEDDPVADLLLRLYRLEPKIRAQKVELFSKELAETMLLELTATVLNPERT